MPGPRNSLLITDFDGTLTREDFYALVVPRFLEADLPDYWTEYATGRLTHFEAMKAIFGHIRTTKAALRKVVRKMHPDPMLAESVEHLRSAGWEVEVVSAGCRWYIDQVLEAAKVELMVHASPGTFTPELGLVMELPTDSPYASQKTGIDKCAVVRDALGKYGRVAFAGNGPPDLEPALMVEPGFRFATGWLTGELTRRREGHTRFSVWSEVARALVSTPPGIVR